jgi:hypothetical protein
LPHCTQKYINATCKLPIIGDWSIVMCCQVGYQNTHALKQCWKESWFNVTHWTQQCVNSSF